MGSIIRGTAAPGVYATVNAGIVGGPAQIDTSDTGFFVIYSTWGPVNQAKSITGLTELTSVYGGLNPNSHGISSIHNFFRQGGQRAWVNRVVGGSAAVATATMNDRAGTPLATTRADGKFPSTAINDIQYKVEAGSVANTVKLTFRSLKRGVASPVEVFDNFKLTFTQQELDDINAGLSRLTTIQQVNDLSNLVKLTNLNSATAAPNNLPALSAVVSGVVQWTTLTGGSDNFGGITDATYIGTDDGLTKTGLQVFADEDFGTGQVMLPGVTTQAAHLAIIAHCKDYLRSGILDLPLGTDRDAAITARRLLDSPYAAMYWPWCKQKALEGTGDDKYYPPSGFVAGVYARAEAEVGVHKAPANYQLASVLDVEPASNGAPQTNQASRALLNANEVNVISPFPREGVKVYGARVLASFGRVTAVHQQRVLNRVYYDLKNAYRQFPFAPLDAEGRLFREARSVAEQYLRLLYRSGALTSTSGNEDDAFLVVCDSNNNPPASIDLKQLNVEIDIHIVEMAEMVHLAINNIPISISLGSLRQ